MIGTALAAALGSNPLTSAMNIALLDRQAPAKVDQRLSSVPENRVSTIAPATIRILQQAGSWPHVQPPNSAAFSNMQVWDSAGTGHVEYHADLLGADILGHVVENSVLIRALTQKLPASVTSLQPASVEAIHLPGFSSTEQQGGSQLATVSLEDGRHIRTRLLVAADGARSRMRSLAKLRTVQWMYNQKGLVATVRTAEPHATAWQRFLPTGPLALLPVRHGYSNIVWSTSPAHAAELEASSPAGFVAAVNEALQTAPTQPSSGLASMQSFLQPGKSMTVPPLVSELAGDAPRSFPLALCHAGRYVRPRFALIGDAAHAVHPLAGQGVNLGFGDVHCLAQALAAASESGTDIGSLAFLEELYERPRQQANVTMMGGLDMLKRLFTPQQGMLASFRNFGLDAVNASPMMKKQIMSYAMG
ncbi:hypothetical protein WJX74_001614 [Apatococcus lobatus]|uniref:FAD-binding domain-containing protein n=2 Tax=Apatococcus TaxID=904362 RepID=A0AAW1STR0_9CHLO